MIEKIKHSHCCYCRRGFSEIVPHLKRTKDHFIPSSRTWKSGENILQCCLECNRWKGDKTPEKWLAEVEEMQRRNRFLGKYKKVDYCQIIGSIRHWIRFYKDKIVSDYNYNVYKEK